VALLVTVGLVGSAKADVILSASGLNDSLKAMERLRQQITTAGPSAHAETVFQLGTEADALAQLLNDEVAAHGSQEKLLIDLAVARTAEMGIAIAYHPGKKKFFYDNAAFRQYLEVSPRGPRMADAEFKLLEGEFFQSNPDDTGTVKESARLKTAFLRRFPRFARCSEVSLMLAVDYRDLFRHFDRAGDATNRRRYLALTRRQLRTTAQTYRDTEEARIAAEMLRRFEAELRTE
jgi:hypothetical protein